MNNDQNKKKLEIAMALTINPVMEYLSYVTDQPDLFDGTEDDTRTLDFKKTETDEIFKLKVAVVDSDWMFPLERCSNGQVRKSMEMLLQFSKISLRAAVAFIKENKPEYYDRFEKAEFVTDPANTTTFVHGESIKTQTRSKRLGFIWA